MMITVIENFLYQILFSIGSIVFFGAIISYCIKLCCKNFGHRSKIFFYATGIIGAPIHELSHAIFCLLFHHKIIEIKLFQIDSKTGILGYVHHSYNKNNWYQKIGNFFIGIAPIIVISLILYLLLLWMLPDIIYLIKTEVVNFYGIRSIINIFKILSNCFKNIYFWLYIIVSLFLVLHIHLSKLDIKGALSGVFFLLVVIFLVNLFISLISIKMYEIFYNTFIEIAIFLNIILILSTCLVFNLVLLSSLYKLIISIVRKK